MSSNEINRDDIREIGRKLDRLSNVMEARAKLELFKELREGGGVPYSAYMDNMTDIYATIMNMGGKVDERGSDERARETVSE